MKPPAKQIGPTGLPEPIKITENQRQILLQLFAGSPVDEIAKDTGRSPSTIFNTVRRVREQLGARNDFDLLRECLRRRIVKLSEISAIADRLRREQHPPPGRLSGG